VALGYDFVLVRLSVRAFEAPGDRKLRFIEPPNPMGSVAEGAESSCGVGYMAAA